MDATEPLNPAQHRAVQHPGGPLLILAGAGSGKTRVITHRLVELSRRGVDPRRVLAVTFTNKAAGEMRERISRLLPGVGQALWIGTFHSTCARLLRRFSTRVGLPPDFVIFDDGDQMQLVNQVLRELDVAAQSVSARAVLSAIDRAKNAGKGPEEVHGDFFLDLVGRVYARYQERLREMSAVDFGDLLLLPLRLDDGTGGGPLGGLFDHVLVDEFQDVNHVQYRLLKLLAGRTRQLVVVGDDDQAIYAWRGADVKLILGFQTDWPDAAVVRLEQNYRSTPVILQAANAVIAKNRDRHEKTLFSEQRGGPPIVVYTAESERGEAEFVATTIRSLAHEDQISVGDFAICYRTNAQSRVLEEALRAHGVPYTVVGGMRFYDRAEVKDLLCYLRICQNPADEVALRRVINVPPRGIGDATIDKLESRARAGGVTLWQALSDAVHGDHELLGAQARRRLRAFVELIDELRVLGQQGDLAALADAVLERSGYMLRLSNDGGPEAQARRENVMEFIGSIKERAAAATTPLTLTEYLEQIALTSSVDTSSAGVALMTIHAAKGLEFPVVFVTGLEDGLFPSRRRNIEERDQDSEAEERRLAYVAITRARRRLILTHARERRLYGQQPRIADPSPFLDDLPAGCVLRKGRRGGAAAPRPALHFSTSGRPARGPRVDMVDEEAGVRIEREDAPEVDFERGAGARRPASSSSHVEYDDAADRRGGFRLGQIVRHEKYGDGEVRGFSGGGSRLSLTVFFPSFGSKTLIAEYLSPVD